MHYLNTICLEDGWKCYAFKTGYNTGWQQCLYYAAATLEHMTEFKIYVFDKLSLPKKEIKINSPNDILTIPEHNYLKIDGCGEFSSHTEYNNNFFENKISILFEVKTGRIYFYILKDKNNRSEHLKRY